MARYLACLLYRLITKGEAYVDRGAKYYESRRQERERIALEHRAAAQGFKLVPVAAG
jgi:transposase